MVKSRSTITVLLGLAAATTLAAVADEPAATMNLVARDARGRAIRNLTPADLEVHEAGEPRRVSSVVHRSGSRRIAVFLDDYHVTAGSHSERARATAGAILQMARPGDDLVVMQPLDARPPVRPVAGEEDVRGRIAGFEGRKGDFAPRTSFEAEYMSSAPAAVARERAQVVRAALLALVAAMREEPDAAKALVVITEGFEEPRTRRRLTTLRVIARAARLANLPVYVVDPSGAARTGIAFDESWESLPAHTGGTLFEAGHDAVGAARRIAADLDAQYLVSFEPAALRDGSFRALNVRGTRAGMSVRAPSGYWTPFAASTLAAATPRIRYSELLTPHVSGLIEPWFRMSPGAGGRTRVTFLWSPKAGAARAAAAVAFAAITFEGTRLHEATVQTRSAEADQLPLETSFEAAPGPLQISMAVSDGSKLLDTDVRYIDVPALDADRPVITGVEFIRPRSLPEFVALRSDTAALPTPVREFLRRDRLLLRVRAFAGQTPAAVQVRLVNLRGGVLLELPPLGRIGDASQFELPFARFARGDYRLEIRATSGSATVSQLLPIRLIG